MVINTKKGEHVNLKNLLIIAGTYYPNVGGTANILEVLSSLLIQSGFSVTVLKNHTGSDEDQNYIHNDVNVISVGTYSKGFKKKMLVHFKKKEFIQLIRTLFYAAYKRVIGKVETIKALNIDNVITEESKINSEIAKIVNEQKIDLVISVCAPFDVNYWAYQIKKKTNVKWVMYMLDPFFDNYTLPNKKIETRKKIEKKILESVDLAIATDPIYKSYKKNGFDQYLYKVISLNFPNIREVIHKANEDDIKFDADYINCVFTGYLYPDIRNPKFVFDIFKSLNNERFRLYILGGVRYDKQFEDGFIEYYKKALKGRLIFVKDVDKYVALNATLNADILINIGNTVANQMPSKIFDYISCGKPIVNFYKVKDCPTLEFTQKHPLCLDVYEGNGLSEELISNVEDFCIENKSKRISYSTINEIYADCTGKVVGRKFVEAIEKVLEDKV